MTEYTPQQIHGIGKIIGSKVATTVKSLGFIITAAADDPFMLNFDDEYAFIYAYKKPKESYAHIIQISLNKKTDEFEVDNAITRNNPFYVRYVTKNPKEMIAYIEQLIKQTPEY